jgi:predicted phage terminase large subunit-like protein
LILLDAKKGRWDFPDLKRKALEFYKFWKPDCVLIEAKASGLPLTQELRRTGIPVVNYSPGGRNKSTDKVSRANSVSPIFEAGMVWAPDQPWAEEVVEEMAAFPFGENDDLTDSSVQAVIRFRQGNFIGLPDDFEDEPLDEKQYVYY